MPFDSLAFVLALGCTFLLWRITGLTGAILLLSSIAFYAVAGWADVFLVVTLILMNYAASFRVAESRGWLAGIVALNVAILAFFKYRAFIAANLGGTDFYAGQILIPLGISFYIFQLIAYQVDIARRHCQVEGRLDRFVLFVIFFPQLIAGPIMRAAQLLPQVRAALTWRPFIRRRALILPLGLILLGLVKKVYLADSLAPHVDNIFVRGPADAWTAWIGIWLFSFQIYFDFSGYSDMAVGLARLFGFRVPFNFRQPYLSRSPQEFWKRWHVTLSTWIRDYLYIPLGGSRSNSAVRNAMVLLLTMGLAGLWHGAAWTFIWWGVGWGMLVLIWRPFADRLARFPVLSWSVMMFAVLMLWVLFRSSSLEMAGAIYATLFGFGSAGSWAIPVDGLAGFWAIIGCAALMALHMLEREIGSRSFIRLLVRQDGPLAWGLAVGLIFWLVFLPETNANPFIYFRF